MAIADVLLIIDMQNGVCRYEDQTIGKLDHMIEEINKRIAKYTSEKKQVIFIRHSDNYIEKGSQKWEVLSELDTSQTEQYIDKTHPNAFYQTDLKEVLDKLDAHALEICGVETQYCVDSTVKFAHGLGYAIQMQKGVNSAWDSEQMTGEQTVRFYEDVWNGSFVTFID